MEHTGKNVKADETYIANPKKLGNNGKNAQNNLIIRKTKKQNILI